MKNEKSKVNNEEVRLVALFVTAPHTVPVGFTWLVFQPQEMTA